jgi:hypothetical protein
VTAVALALAGAAFAAGPLASLPPGWSHAAVNIVGPKGQAHTVVYDRGKVTAVGPLTLTLNELDSSIVKIAVAATATVKLNGQPGTFSQLQVGDNAMTMGIDGSPAIQVQATAPPAPPVTTQGRVIAVGPSSVTLREQDGTVVTIAVAANAIVKVNGQAGSLSQIQPGFSATTVTVGGLPARAVRSSGKLHSTTSTSTALSIPSP